jgi:hypothetical protein
MSMVRKKEQYFIDTEANLVKTDSIVGFLTVSDQKTMEAMIDTKVRELNSTLTDSETKLVNKLREYESELKRQRYVVAQLQQNQALFSHFIREMDLQWYEDNVIKKQESGREEPPRQSQLDWLRSLGS